MEIPSVDFEKNRPKFEDLRKYCKDETEFDDLVLKISLLEVILGQVNELFIGSIYNEEAKALINAANSSTKKLQEEVVNIYIRNSKEAGKLLPIPDIEEISSWVEEIHYDIASQLYTKDFCDTVITPALETITTSIIEFANEETNSENENENENEELK